MKGLLFIFMILNPLLLFGNEIKPLKIGEQIPDLLIRNVINHSATSVSTASLKGKLVIIDFWSLGCTSCIASFPKLEALQKEFGDKIQIISVIQVSEKQVDNYLKKIGIRKPNVMMAFADTILSAYFPFRFVPHVIWINQQGTIENITGGQNITKEHISAQLKGIKAQMTRKTSDVLQMSFDSLGMDAYLTQLDHLEFIYRSFIMPYNEQMPQFIGRTGYDSVDAGYRKAFLNCSIYNLYFAAFDIRSDLPTRLQPNRMLYDTVKLSFLKMPNDPNQIDDWLRRHCFSYYQQMPKNDADGFIYMQEDLNRVFRKRYGIEGKLIQKEVLCRILVSDKPSGEKRTGSRSVTYNGKLLLTILASTYGKTGCRTPFVNESDISASTLINITNGFKDEESLVADLNSAGLNLITEKRKIDFLVIE